MRILFVLDRVENPANAAALVGIYETILKGDAQ